ncbi:hypothetical protein CJD36_021030 [Flavipsychrobacter stenotrophus]|uniref:Uncharacterized protein n=1 Tax=Flavipsychrobacter stenotrophus TaxID=2077091 RepID=A0A2S7SQ77_9BACT|nr:hypothetical protein [Flavipsychrobacter stenotrophus]PQJ09063.1 hypothetical protein CJD36_021030 [Flavipsychrobacter stenotrophus]
MYTISGKRIYYREVKKRIKPVVDSAYLHEWGVKRWQITCYKYNIFDGVISVETENNKKKYNKISIKLDSNYNVLKTTMWYDFPPVY